MYGVDEVESSLYVVAIAVALGLTDPGHGGNVDFDSFRAIMDG